MLKILFVLALIFHTSPIQSYTDPASCTLCEVVFSSIITFLNGSNADHDIEKAIDTVCDILPISIKGSCYSMASNLAKFLITLPKLADREDFTPFALCCMYDVCQMDCCLSKVPEQVHIAFYDRRDQMAVNWVTLDKTDSIVYYGVSDSALNMMAKGSVKTYTRGSWKGWVHEVILNGLSNGTRYFYKVGSNESGFSQVFNFYTEKKFVENVTPIRIAVYGDQGADPQAVVPISILEKIVANHEIDFIIHNGDIGYADGFQHRWDMYMREIQNIAANTPYMVTPGNHEIGVVGLLNATQGYQYRFTLPGKYSTTDDIENLYYSFNYGNVHFIAFDTESVFDIPGITEQQLEWIEKDLKSLDRKMYPWVIAFGHRPLYCSNPDFECNKGNGEFSLYLRNALEPLFNKYGVQIVFEAHKHDYERTYPVFKAVHQPNYVNPKFPTYLLSGAGGNREGNPHFEDRPDWSATAISQWGYGILTIYNSTKLDWKFYTTSDNQLKDSFVMTRNN